MQIKTTVRYHLTLVRMATSKTSINYQCWWGHGEKGRLLNWWSKGKLIQPLWKTVWRFLKKLKLPSVQITHSVVSDSLRPYRLQHARPPCPSPTPRDCSNSCPLSWWCHPTTLSSVVPLSSCLQSFPASGSESKWVSSLHQVTKVLELQHQPFQRTFRIDFLSDWLVWFPCSSMDSQTSSPAPQFRSISSSVLSFLYDPALTSIQIPWGAMKNPDAKLHTHGII